MTDRETLAQAIYEAEAEGLSLVPWEELSEAHRSIAMTGAGAALAHLAQDVDVEEIARVLWWEINKPYGSWDTSISELDRDVWRDRVRAVLARASAREAGLREALAEVRIILLSGGCEFGACDQESDGACRHRGEEFPGGCEIVRALARIDAALAVAPAPAVDVPRAVRILRATLNHCHLPGCDSERPCSSCSGVEKALAALGEEVSHE